MIQIQSAKLVEGTDYDSWVQVFESQEAIKMRADAGLKILAYGWNAEKERVFTVAEMDDPQTVQKMMKPLKQQQSWQKQVLISRPWR